MIVYTWNYEICFCCHQSFIVLIFLSPLVLSDFDTINYLFLYISDAVVFFDFNMLSMVLVILCWYCQCFLNMSLIFLFFWSFYSFFIYCHCYHLIFLIVLCFYSVLWTMFVSVTFTEFNVMLRGECFCVQLFIVYNFCWCFDFSVDIFVELFCFWGFCFIFIFMILLCLLISMGSVWFLWLDVSVIGTFNSVTDVYDFSVIISVTDVAALYLPICSKHIYIVLIPFIYIKPGLFYFVFYAIFVGANYLFGMVCFGMFYFCLCRKNIIWHFSLINCDIIFYPVLYIILCIIKYDIKWFFILFHI